MSVSIEALKKLREETGISMMECRNALEEANGDIEKAKQILREKGKEMIKGREGRETGKGLIASYIHPGCQIGVLLELRCETDFVARSDDFKNLAHELCLHIAASRPLFLDEDDIPEDFLNREKEIFLKQLEDDKKPDEIKQKIVEGKLAKLKKEISLMNQPWVKDPNKTIRELVNEYKAKIGENIGIGKFVRFEI